MDRERISITVRKNLLAKLDSTVDGVKIRSRSHALDYYLSKALSPSVSKAIILCGGMGTKMRPFTYEMPKAMLPIHGRPLLEHTIELLKRYQITQIILSVGDLGDKIRDHFGSGEKFGVRTTYLRQPGAVGTGGALAMAEGMLQNETFLLMHGDILADIDLDDLISFHQESDYVCSLALTSASNAADFGVAQVKRNQIVAFDEKPDPKDSASNLVNAGIAICEPAIFALLPIRTPCSLENDVFHPMATQGKLGGYFFAGKWFDIGTPKHYEQALKGWHKNPAASL